MPQRYHHASPLAQVGDGARVVCVHGDADDTVPLSQSERYVEAALRAGDPAKLIVLPRIGHFELIDVRHPAWDACRDQVLQDGLVGRDEVVGRHPIQEGALNQPGDEGTGCQCAPEPVRVAGRGVVSGRSRTR